MRGSRKFGQRVSNFDVFFLFFCFSFLVDEGISGAIIGPLAKRHLSGVSLTCYDGPTLNAGLIAL